MSQEERLERLRGATIVPVPTGEELQRITDEAEQTLAEIEAEEQADLDALDGGTWPPQSESQSA